MSSLDNKKIPFPVLILLISFATVNAMIVAPAFPKIASDFGLDASSIQSIMTGFLLGYTFGQLVYGPLTARFGRKKTLFLGIGLQLFANALCLIANFEKSLSLLILARVLVALGAGVGLKMTFTLIHDDYHGVEASRKTSQLLSAFAITPAIAIFIGGWLSTYWHYQWCFVFCMLYGIVLFYLIWNMPKKEIPLDQNALKIKNIFLDYFHVFKHLPIILGGIVMGLTSSMIYVFAGIAPFVAEHHYQLNTNWYGALNLFAASGILWGSLLAARLTQTRSTLNIMWIGFVFLLLGILFFWLPIFHDFSAFSSLFLPMFFLQLGMPLIFSNASILALKSTTNHSHGSACISFLNLGTATISSLYTQHLAVSLGTLSIFFSGLVILVLFGLLYFSSQTQRNSTS